MWIGGVCSCYHDCVVWVGELVKEHNVMNYIPSNEQGSSRVSVGVSKDS